MDAISFVFGVRSAQLRGTQLRDLVHRKETETPAQIKSRTAHVELVFIKADGATLRFRRSITSSGASEHTVNSGAVTAAGYNKELELLGVLVASRNFLVFQGDVESVARKTPKEIAALIEELSGSARLREEYEKKKDSQVAAEDEMIRSFERKKNMNKERKQLREQKEEADRFQTLTDELKGFRVEFMLWQLYNVDKDRTHEIAALDGERNALLARREEARKVESVEDELLRDKATLHKDRVALEKRLAVKQREAEKKLTVVSKLEEQLAHTQKQADEAAKKLATAQREHQQQVEQRTSLQTEIEAVAQTLTRVEAAEASDHDGFQLQAAQVAEYQQLKNQANAQTGAISREAESARREYDALEERHSHQEHSMQTLRDRLKEVFELIPIFVRVLL